MSEISSKNSADIDTTVATQQKIQQSQDALDAKAGNQKHSKDGEKPMQAGHSNYPENPLPAQKLQKPGLESAMQLKPMYLAEHYKGSGKLEGKAALITGADSGIGRAVAVLYAREGADVAIAYLNEHTDAEETLRCVQAEGGRCILLPGDVKDADYCQSAVQKVVDAFGKLDILVNNAAFQMHAESITDITEERFDETLKTNVYGYFHMAKAAVPHLPVGGAIINTGSVVGLKGSGELIDYATTKGAIHAFTMSLASSLLKKGIRVNAVAPGPVWTPLNPADKKAEDVVNFGSNTDIGRVAQPEELSPAYVFLAAPCCSSYITGIVLPVTGTVGS